MGRAEPQLALMGGSCQRRPLARFLNGQAHVGAADGWDPSRTRVIELLPRVADTDAASFQRLLVTRTFRQCIQTRFPAIQKAYQAKLRVDYATARHEISTDSVHGVQYAALGWR